MKIFQLMSYDSAVQNAVQLHQLFAALNPWVVQGERQRKQKDKSRGQKTKRSVVKSESPLHAEHRCVSQYSGCVLPSLLLSYSLRTKFI